MCGRYAVFTEDENIEIKSILNELNKKFADSEALSSMKTGEIFPTNIVPVVTAESGLSLLKWGFPNFKQASASIINARCETIAEKPTFKRLIDTKRCIVPASGFFEWKAIEGEKKKIKHLIRFKGSNFFTMAGLYNTFKDTEGRPYTAFVILTTEPCTEMAEIHDRMPVMLNRDESKIWLKADYNEASKLFDQRERLLDIKIA